ncbi:MAG: WG repeat-containing protein, partial [Bacteroidia bacterium]|nr:WG repeat-containing protein [Bacteroidia bacterium]
MIRFLALFSFIWFWVPCLQAQNLIPFTENGLIGFRKIKGNIVIKPQFHQVTPFRNGMAAVQQNERWGVIDSTGKWILAPIHGFVKHISSLAIVVSDSGYFDEKIYLQGKYGIIDTNGTILLAPQFLSPKPFQNGTVILEKNKKFGLVSTNGSIVLPIEQDIILPIETTPEFYFFRRQGKWGVAHRNGTIPIPPNYKEITLNDQYIAGLLWVRVNDTSNAKKFWYGVLDSASGKLTIPTAYSELTITPAGLIRYGNQNKEGLITKDERTILEPIYEKITVKPIADSFFAVTTILKSEGSEPKTGVMDKQGNWLLPPNYTEVSVFDSTLFKVKRDKNLVALIDHRKKMRFAYLYYDLIKINNQFIAFYQDGNWGMVDYDGKLIIPPQYNSIQAINERFFLVKQITDGDTLLGVHTADGR